MKLFAIYKDGELFRASYDQNTPYYLTYKGAEMAIRYLTNKRNLPIGETEEGYKLKFIIKEFDLVEVRKGN